MDTDSELQALAAELRSAPFISFDTETTSVDEMQADLVGISLSTRAGVGWYIPVGHAAGRQLPLEKILAGLRGPIEESIIAVAARPAVPETWRRLLSSLATIQFRIDRNKALRDKIRAVPLLDPRWAERAWPLHAPATFRWLHAGSGAPTPAVLGAGDCSSLLRRAGLRVARVLAVDPLVQVIEAVGARD